MIYGVIFSFLASVFFDLNNLLEKRAVDRMAEISVRRVAHMVRLLLTDTLWMSGFFAGIVAVGLMLLAYSLAPIAVVQAIYGAGLVLLVVASRLYLHETMGRREWIGVALIIVALVLVSLSLGTANPRVGGGSWFSVLMTSLATMLVSVLAFVALRRSSADLSVPFGVTSGLFYGVAALQVKGASVLFAHKGLVGSVLPLLTSAYPYLFLAASVLGVLVFQTGLQRCRVSVVGPITNIVGSIYVVAVGMVVFDEPFPSDATLTTLRVIGFALVLIGGAVFVTPPAGRAPRGGIAAGALDPSPERPGPQGHA